MATRAHSELFCLAASDNREGVGVLTCEDLPDDWADFRSFHEVRTSTPMEILPITLSRNLTIDLAGSVMILTRTASIDETGRTLHSGDLRAQIRRAFVNISELLAAAGGGWNDVVRATCFVRDRVRDGAIFQEELDCFCINQEIPTIPSSRAVEAILSRCELLVEVETIAIVAT